jgi:hypothetical protein
MLRSQASTLKAAKSASTPAIVILRGASGARSASDAELKDPAALGTSTEVSRYSQANLRFSVVYLMNVVPPIVSTRNDCP